jgi:hypothetical protein
MPRNVPTTPSLLALALLVPFASACGGKIAAEDPGIVELPAPTAIRPRVPTLDEYCSALSPSLCGDDLCVSDAECRTSYANASEAYLRAVVDCRREGQLTCGYPDECVFARIGPTAATPAQVAVADLYCRSCFPEVDAEQCRTAALRPENEGPTLSLGLRALADATAERALDCEGVRATQFCAGDFITCLAKYRPVARVTACSAVSPP